MKRLAAGLMLCLAAAAADAAAPQRVTATYDFTRNGTPAGIVSETFTRTGNQYRIESETKAVGILALFARERIRLISSGLVTREGLRPLRFEHHRGSDPGKAVVADFDWERHTLTLKHDGNSDSLPLEPGTQDRISLMYQFMFLPNPDDEIALRMTNGKSVEHYRYRRAGRERLETAAGRFDTLHYSRERQPGENGTELWLTPERHHFPAKILFEDKNGGKMEQTLTRLRFE